MMRFCRVIVYPPVIGPSRRIVLPMHLIIVLGRGGKAEIPEIVTRRARVYTPVGDQYITHAEHPRSGRAAGPLCRESYTPPSDAYRPYVLRVHDERSQHVAPERNALYVAHVRHHFDVPGPALLGDAQLLGADLRHVQLRSIARSSARSIWYTALKLSISFSSRP